MSVLSKPTSVNPRKLAGAVAAIGQWCSGWNELTLDGKLLGHAELLEETKYSRAEYNQKR